MLKKYLLVIILTFFVVNCSDDNPTEPDEDKAVPELNIKQIETPTGLEQNNDQHAFAARTWIAFANSFNMYSYMWTPPTTSKKLNKTLDEWTRTWSDPNTGIEVKLVAYDNTLNFGWDVYLSGTMDGTTFNEQKVLEAQEIKATKSGMVTFFDFDTQEKAFAWNYATTSTDIYSVNYLVYDSGVVTDKIEVISNDDNSGSVKIYDFDGTVEVLKNIITWNADGTGTWAEYDSSGNLTDSGTF